MGHTIFLRRTGDGCVVFKEEEEAEELDQDPSSVNRK